MPRILELFSGTGSIGKVFREGGWEVTSVDINKKFKADLTENILYWEYQQFPVGHFDVIWSSPPCTTFSKAKFSNIGRYTTYEQCMRDIETQGLPVLHKTLEIIDYFQPKYWMIENPRDGKMKDFMPDELDYDDCSYCQYGMSYRKNTRIWNNVPSLGLKKCDHTGKHEMAMGIKGVRQLTGSDAVKAIIPQLLVEQIYKRLNFLMEEID